MVELEKTCLKIYIAKIHKKINGKWMGKKINGKENNSFPRLQINILFYGKWMGKKTIPSLDCK